MALYAKTVERVKNVFEKIQELISLKKYTPSSDKNELASYTDGIVPVLMRECILTYTDALKILNMLERNGYVEFTFEGRKIVELETLKQEWSGLPKEEIKVRKPPKKIGSSGIKRKVLRRAKHPAAEKIPEHCSVLFADWSNLEGAAIKFDEVVNTLVHLEKTLVENHNTIEIKFVFVPDHRIEQARKLSTHYRYVLIACPRTYYDKNNGVIFKDKDMVDTLITKLAHFISLYSSWVTHIVLVSGDGDFAELVSVAKNHGKKVTVASYAKALSKVLEELADDLIML